MRKILPIILVIVTISVIVMFMTSNQTKKATPPLSSQDISPTSTSHIDLGAGGNSYLDEKGVFSILYPNDYILDTQDPIHVRIYKRGETQRPQSEMSDGVLVVFETIDLAGSSLETLVDTRIKESTADGTSEIVEAKKAITLNSYSGFSYALRGLGTSNNLILQKDKNSKYAVSIVYSVNDPGEKGYQKELDAILSSLTLVK